MVARCCLLILLAASRGIWWILEQPRGSLLEQHPAFQLLMRKIRIFRKHIRMSDFGGLTDKGTWLYSGRVSRLKWCKIPVVSCVFEGKTPQHQESKFHENTFGIPKPTIQKRYHHGDHLEIALSSFYEYTFVPSGHQEINDIEQFRPTSLPERSERVNLVDVYYDSRGIKRVKGNKNLKRSQAYPRQPLSLVCPFIPFLFSKPSMNSNASLLCKIKIVWYDCFKNMALKASPSPTKLEFVWYDLSKNDCIVNLSLDLPHSAWTQVWSLACQTAIPASPSFKETSQGVCEDGLGKQRGGCQNQ